MDRILPTYARQIKESTIDSIHRWVDYGIPPGGFLQAVLKNDLKGACQRADSDNILVLPLIVSYIYNCCPAACWGSPENYNEWIAYKQSQREIE